MRLDWKLLAQTSLRDPRAAARQIMALELGRDVLWSALALITIANTFLTLLIFKISPPAVTLPSYFDRPLVVFVLLAGITVVYVHAMYWAGLSIGGKGALMDVLALVVWFQVLRTTAQAGLVLISLAIPSLGALAALVVAGWGLWIFLNFLAEALHLTSAWHSIAVLMVAFVGLVLGVGILTALIGAFAQGVVA